MTLRILLGWVIKRKRWKKGNKLGVCVPHTLNEKNKDRKSIVTSLLSKQRNDSFLKIIITGDKKWVFYDDVQHKKQWVDKDEFSQPTPKVELHGKNHAVCLLGSLRYYSVWVFKPQSVTQCWLIRSVAATCVWKSYIYIYIYILQ